MWADGLKKHENQTVGAALLCTLEKRLGERRNPEIKAALKALAGIMTSAARNVKQAA